MPFDIGWGIFAIGGVNVGVFRQFKHQHKGDILFLVIFGHQKLHVYGVRHQSGNGENAKNKE
jgi:hypothetical protein